MLPEHDYGTLQTTIEAELGKAELQVLPALVKKIIQLYETMVVRHGVMLVGPTGGGKTTSYQVHNTPLETAWIEGRGLGRCPWPVLVCTTPSLSSSTISTVHILLVLYTAQPRCIPDVLCWCLSQNAKKNIPALWMYCYFVCVCVCVFVCTCVVACYRFSNAL